MLTDDEIDFGELCRNLWVKQTSKPITQREIEFARAIIAAAAPASQQGEQRCDTARVLEWMRTPNRKPAQLAFTAGPERQVAYWIEIAQAESSHPKTESALAQQSGPTCWADIDPVDGEVRVTYSRTFDMPAERFAAIQTNLETMRGLERIFGDKRKKQEPVKEKKDDRVPD